MINAQVEINGKDDKWYARARAQNLTDNSATTGLYVIDQSSGLLTKIYMLEPRRYGGVVGVRF